MTLSIATVTPGNMELTPMRVTFGGVDLGGTLGNVNVSIKTKKSPIKADQFGDTILDQRISGYEVLVTTELAEVSNKDNWKAAFSWLKEVTSGGNKGIYADMQIGRSDIADAGILILHPLSKGDSDYTGDFKFYKAVCSAESEVIMGPNDQVKLKVVFRILPDTSVTPAKWFFHGDPTISLTAASAAAASMGGGNTGGGTVGSITAGSAAATETITGTCVTAGATGKFYISGSVSGALGLATVGTAFTSTKINLTISDGSPDFAVGDTFTIAVTAANYS